MRENYSQRSVKLFKTKNLESRRLRGQRDSKYLLGQLLSSCSNRGFKIAYKSMLIRLFVIRPLRRGTVKMRPDGEN